MKVYDLVKKILQENQKARSSDKELIWEVAEEMHLVHKDRPNLLYGDLSRSSFMTLPSFESITRARRKVQENHPELQASKPVQKFRNIKSKEKGTFIYREKVEELPMPQVKDFPRLNRSRLVPVYQMDLFADGFI